MPEHDPQIRFRLDQTDENHARMTKTVDGVEQSIEFTIHELLHVANLLPQFIQDALEHNHKDMLERVRDATVKPVVPVKGIETNVDPLVSAVHMYIHTSLGPISGYRLTSALARGTAANLQRYATEVEKSQKRQN